MDRAHQPECEPQGSTPLPPPFDALRRGISPSSAVAGKSLIATVPRIEISVTRSFKRRKHFLIATRMRVSCAFRSLLPGRGCFSVGTRLPLPKTVKINRNTELLEPRVCCSKQRTGAPINRNKSGTPATHSQRFSCHSLALSGCEGTLATSHFRVLHFPASKTPGRLTPTMLDRRHFLSTCSGFGLGATLFPGALIALAEDKPAVTIDMIDKAAAIAGVAIPEDDRQMMLDPLNDRG